MILLGIRIMRLSHFILNCMHTWKLRCSGKSVFSDRSCHRFLLAKMWISHILRDYTWYFIDPGLPSKLSYFKLLQSCSKQSIISLYMKWKPSRKNLSKSCTNDLKYFSWKINSYSQLNCALLPICKVFHFEYRLNFRGKNFLKLGLVFLLGN